MILSGVSFFFILYSFSFSFSFFSWVILGCVLYWPLRACGRLVPELISINNVVAGNDIIIEYIKVK